MFKIPSTRSPRCLPDPLQIPPRPRPDAFQTPSRPPPDPSTTLSKTPSRTLSNLLALVNYLTCSLHCVGYCREPGIL
eukprot:9765991-Karenia_brevis.AAC.1